MHRVTGRPGRTRVPHRVGEQNRTILNVDEWHGELLKVKRKCWGSDLPELRSSSRYGDCGEFREVAESEPPSAAIDKRKVLLFIDQSHAFDVK